MKKIIFCLMILFSVSTIAYAQEIPGRPGRYAMDRAFILVGPPYMPNEGEPYWCGAYYADPVGPNPYDGIGNQTELDPKNIQFINVTMNKRKVIAICKFTDEDLPYETNAQVGDIIVNENIRGCTLEMQPCVCGGGTGHITAAANLAGFDPIRNADIGGTVTLKCTFDPRNCSNCN